MGNLIFLFGAGNFFLFFFLLIVAELNEPNMINKHSVAGTVLQTPPSLIDSLFH